MTFWLYDPKKLASSSTLVPYRQSNLGEILNFLTITCMVFYLYLYKTKQLQTYGNILLTLFISIFFLGIILGLPANTKTKNILEDFSDYENSLFIE